MRDEVEFLDSLNAFRTFFHIPITCYGGHLQPLYGFLISLVKKLIPLSPIYLARIPSVIIGTATVFLTYQLTKAMYGKRTGLIAASLLCCLPWHVIQSRLGISVILIPFFGCLIFLSLFNAIHKKSKGWFFISYLPLVIGSFYSYQAGLAYIPIFVVIILFLKKDLFWLDRKVIVMWLLFFLMSILPFICLHVCGKINFFNGFYRNYHTSLFQGSFLINFVTNLKNNGLLAAKGLFFNSLGAKLPYSPTLQSPLLINLVVLFIIIISIAIFLRCRKPQDKIILIWFGLGYVCSFSCIAFLTRGGNYIFFPRYMISALVPSIILLSRFIDVLLIYSKKCFSDKKILFYIGICLWMGLIFTECAQLARYYKIAPTNLEECRVNNYGCGEAAEYLKSLPDIKDYGIVFDNWMEPLKFYLDLSIWFNSWNSQSKTGLYYIIWAPQSHPEELWDGFFSRLYISFKQKYPNELPIKIIYYPNGLPAINIYKIRDIK